MSRRVLVIEDDPPIGAGIVRALRRAGFEPELETDGQRGIERAIELGWSLVVLDLSLPERDGLEVLQSVRARVPTPVIVVTARSDLKERLRAFELGAVDFLPKPFFVEELLARIQARIGGRAQGPRNVTRFGSATLDLDARALSLGAEPVHLAPAEVAILAYPVERPGRAIARADLAALAGAIDGPSLRAVDTHVARLRRKLGAAGSSIVTVWGHGYRFDPERAG